MRGVLFEGKLTSIVILEVDLVKVYHLLGLPCHAFRRTELPRTSLARAFAVMHQQFTDEHKKRRLCTQSLTSSSGSIFHAMIQPLPTRRAATAGTSSSNRSSMSRSRH